MWVLKHNATSIDFILYSYVSCIMVEKMLLWCKNLLPSKCHLEIRLKMVGLKNQQVQCIPYQCHQNTVTIT